MKRKARNNCFRFRVLSRIAMGILSCFLALPVNAATPEQISKEYAQDVKRENPAFHGFSPTAGNSFFHQQRAHSDGKTVSCATCHTSNPRNRGLTRANKEIAPLAPSANPERFTDPAKVEKWFARNCKDVLERSCTSKEKGDFIEYLRSVR